MSESPIELRGKGGGVVFQGTQKPPGGGSQPGAAYLVGPYAVDFSDIAAAGSLNDLFIVPAATLLLTWWTVPETFVVWDGSSGGFNAMLGAGVGGDFDPFVGNALGNLMNSSEATSGDAEAAGGNRTDATGTTSLSPLLDSPGAKIQAFNNTGGTLTAGHVDLYFLLATAPAVI